nr:MAG: hypothetical protein DIU60_12780 [Actinomycetota bacterium]
MSDSRMRKIHPMISLDIENYSGRNEAEQFQAQKSLTNLVETAMREAGVDLNDCWPQFSGDGLFAVLPADTQIDRFAETFIEELNVLLGTHNRRRRPRPWTPIRLRMSLHEGPVRTDAATGIAGDPAVAVNRLIDAEALRVALACCQGADLAVIVSERIYTDHLTAGYGSLDLETFRPVHVAVKRNRYRAYLYVPNCDLYKIPELDRFSLPPDSPPGTDPDSSSGAAPDPSPSSPPPTAPNHVQHITQSAHNIRDSVVNQTNSGDINLRDINLGGRR